MGAWGEGGVGVLLPCHKSRVSYLGFNCGSVINLTSGGKKKEKFGGGGRAASSLYLCPHLWSRSLFLFASFSSVSLAQRLRSEDAPLSIQRRKLNSWGFFFPKKQSHLGHVFKEQQQQQQQL